MLGKLMKYELKSVFKFLMIFYGLAVVFAILTRVLFMVSDSLFWNIVAQVMSGATIAMIINIVINNLMRLWVRFRTSLYGDESYLTHTLPVRRSELYLSKFLVGLVTTVCSVLVIFCVVAIAYLTPENFEALKGMLGFLAGATDMAVVKFVLVVAVVLWLEIFSALVVGYLGIILGYRKLTNRMAWSVGFGLLIYVATQVVVMLGIMALSLVDAGVHDLLFGGEDLGFDGGEGAVVAGGDGGFAIGSGGPSALGAFKAVTVSATVLYAVLVGVNYAVSQMVFRKVDVE